ncbi:MAG: sulfatase-like hydrolase/transferase, partial [Planctomycetota bacterium]
MRTRPGGIGAGRVALGLTVALGLAACGRREAPEDPHPTARNVLLFTVDTLRADALGSYGHPDAPTPHADSLAAEGLRFDKAYSQATLTNSSLTSILTGLLPIQTGVHIQADAFAAGTLPVPLVLQAEGIATGSFIANMCKLQETESTVYHDGWDTRFCGMLDDP